MDNNLDAALRAATQDRPTQEAQRLLALGSEAWSTEDLALSESTLRVMTNEGRSLLTIDKLYRMHQLAAARLNVGEHGGYPQDADWRRMQGLTWAEVAVGIERIERSLRLAGGAR